MIGKKPVTRLMQKENRIHVPDSLAYRRIPAHMLQVPIPPPLSSFKHLLSEKITLARDIERVHDSFHVFIPAISPQDL